MSHYLPVTEEDKNEMLAAIGMKDAEELFSDIPEELKLKRSLKIPEAMAEMELSAHMKSIASQNADSDKYVCFLGAGAYDHFIPSIVGHIISRSEFYTAYTPYQPEISQGVLQAIFEYQTMICGLTAMDVSNASMYDGATALAEAALMAARSAGGNVVAVSAGVHPEYRDVLKTYARFNGIEIVEIGLKDGVTDLSQLREITPASREGSGAPDSTGKFTGGNASRGVHSRKFAGIIVQSPNFYGAIEDLSELAKTASSLGALSIACVDPISLGILCPPGECGVDIAVGDGQPLGNPLSYGGPYLGFMAAKKELTRKMPGRIVGETTDREGRRGFVLTLQAREQHIRREKAVSNICSNQALNALAATVYMSALGRKGLKEVANLCLQKSHYAYEQLLATGCFEKVNDAPFFKEFTVRSLKEPVERINRRLLQHGITGGLDLSGYRCELKDCWLVAVTEKRSKEEIDRMVRLAVKEEE